MKMEHLCGRQSSNLYVKNLDNAIDDERLREEFAAFGTITSAKVMRDGNGRSRRFGFVCFSSPEEAFKAMTHMNGRIIVSKALYVSLAQSKEERKSHLASQYMQRMETQLGAQPAANFQAMQVSTDAESKRRFELMQMERLNKYRCLNVYVKNLDDPVDDERLRKEFAPFGTITSAKVMKDGNGRSRGFGFVCFSSPEEAFKAIREMNGRIVVSKPLYVSLAQSKKERKANLASQYKQRMIQMQMRQSPQSPTTFQAMLSAPFARIAARSAINDSSNLSMIACMNACHTAEQQSTTAAAAAAISSTRVAMRSARIDATSSLIPLKKRGQPLKD